MQSIPESHQDLVDVGTRAFAFLATTMPDGTPQVTPVWFNCDDDVLWINSAIGRVKDRNMRARPAVAICIIDPDNPYRYLQIRGPVVEIYTRGARGHIDTLSEKYTGNSTYANYSGEQRVIYKIRPDHITAQG